MDGVTPKVIVNAQVFWVYPLHLRSKGGWVGPLPVECVRFKIIAVGNELCTVVVEKKLKYLGEKKQKKTPLPKCKTF